MRGLCLQNWIKKSIIISLLITSTISTSNADEIISTSNNFKNYINIADNADGDTLIVASSKYYADSLSSINLIYKNNDKLMLIDYETNLIEMIELLKPTNIIIVGGEKAVSKEVENILKKYCHNVERIAGKDRYETNLLTMKDYEGEVIVASGENFADAISSVNLVKEHRIPIELVKHDQEETRYNGRYTVGGPVSVKNIFGFRIYGKDRYCTNRKTMDRNNSEKLIVNGADFRLPLMASNFIFNKYKNYTLSLTKDMVKKKENDFNRDILLNNEKRELKEIYTKIENGNFPFKIKIKDIDLFREKYLKELNRYYQSEALSVKLTKYNKNYYNVELTSYYDKDENIDRNDFIRNKIFIKDLLSNLNIKESDTAREVIEKLSEYTKMEMPYKQRGDRINRYDSLYRNNGGTCVSYVSLFVRAMRMVGKDAIGEYVDTEYGYHIIMKFKDEDASWKRVEITSGSKPMSNVHIYDLSGNNNFKHYDFSKYIDKNSSLMEGHLFVKNIVK